MNLTDFTFIYEELRENYCLDNGRNATSPILLFKYLLLKVIYGLSDVDVVERTVYDLSFKYFLGLDPIETELIQPATLTKFRRKRLKDSELLNKLLSESIKIAKKHQLIESETIIVDSTHTGARYNFKSPREVLIEQSKLLRKSVYQFNEEYKDKFPKKEASGLLEDHIEYCKKLCKIIADNETLLAIPAVSEKYNVLVEQIEDNVEHLKQSYDEDAKTGHKSADTNFFGYKTHIAINEERLVVAATVTSGEKADGKELKDLVEQSKENGVEVKEVIGDGAYSEKANLKYAGKENIKLVSKLNKAITHSYNKNRNKFEYNKDAQMYVCEAGHIAIKKRKGGSKKDKMGKDTQVETYYFDVEKCKHCVYRYGCYKEGAKVKTFSVKIKDVNHLKQMEYMKSEEFKTRAKERYKIEAINAHLKNEYNYRTASSRGLLGMEIQAATTLFVSNLERILTLIDNK